MSYQEESVYSFQSSCFPMIAPQKLALGYLTAFAEVLLIVELFFFLLLFLASANSISDDLYNICHS